MERVPDTNELAVVAARRLRRAILCQLASPLVLAVGCTPAPPSSDEGNVTTNPGSNDGSTDPSDAEVSSEVDGEEESGLMEDEADDGVELDVAPIPDLPPPAACWMESWEEMVVAATYPDCELGPFSDDQWPAFLHVCVGPIEGDCSEICPPDSLCEGVDGCYLSTIYDICGPYQADDGSCCVVVAGDYPPPVGRPFVVAGELRLASIDEMPRDRVAAHWLEMARGEHASIAAFARFVAILQRLGAPARLVAEALAAAADEARHAEQTLALASHFCGRDLSFGPLEIDDALAQQDDIEAIVRAVVQEGCIDETLAAHEAACLAAHAEHPRVAAVLEQIAADEARHAALAWRFVAWISTQRPELRSVVAGVFASIEQLHLLAEAPQGDDALGLGCAPARLRAHWRRVGVRELVEPCAQNYGFQTHMPL